MNTEPNYDVLCDVISDWLEAHKELTKSGEKLDGVSTPRAARHEYLYDAGLYPPRGERNGRKLFEVFSYVKGPGWPREDERDGRARRAFDARVRADRLDLLREWIIVNDPRSSPLYTDAHRANVDKAIEMARRRIAADNAGAKSSA